ncbi:MAG: TRAP transporter permease [Aestuariibacter sp.]|nr:TRAP transporter permease [Aestuariibacter sp.]
MGDKKLSDKSAEELVAEFDTGARNLSGWQTNLIPYICLAWAVYQLYAASTLPSMLSSTTGIDFFYSIANLTMSRKVHLLFALVLVTLAYPLVKSSPKNRIPIYDWVLILLGVGSILYMIIMNTHIAERAGDFVHPFIRYDMTIASIGIFVLTFSVFRSLGLPLIIVAAALASYVFIGGGNWGGASFVKGMWHFWMQEEGIFGKPLEVSAQTIFLFVLFGAILEKAGAGAYFIKIAFALLGHLRGGPAKAAVIASAMSGLYSGSSIANTVTTGTFTIPLMKKTGLSAEKAGAIEVASSTNGQLTPPVMGAAAFLIAEFTGIAYTEILKHALVPALVSYIALIYIVHLEACKLDLRGLPKPPSTLTFATKLIGVLGGFIGISVLAGLVHVLKTWISGAFPDLTLPFVMFTLAVIYLVLLWVASKRPDLEEDDPDAPVVELPPAGATAITGMHYLLPIVLLLWCILPTPDKLSAHLSAFYACIAMIVVTLTQRPLKAIMRGTGDLVTEFKHGVSDWIEGMIAGARNMISIAIATAAAGVIIGSISLTGAHQVVGEFVEFLSGGSLIIMLILVALMSLILGMGLPTTANYIVVSSLMAPVIVVLGAKSGLLVPLIAVHLFVFYFGILADDTPPVGLAAFAAAAISKGDPIKTGIQGFTYDIRTALLPFLFIFNTELLLIDVSLAKAIFVFVVAVIAMMLFASATQGYMFTHNRKWESAALLLIAFTLFRPGYWLDQVIDPYHAHEPTKVYDVINEVSPNGNLTMVVSGPDFDSGEVTSTTILVNLGKPKDAIDRLRDAGLSVVVGDGRAVIEEPFPGTPFFETIGKSFDYYGDEPVQVSRVLRTAKRMPKEVFYIPALLLLAIIMVMQKRRSREQQAAI